MKKSKIEMNTSRYPKSEIKKVLLTSLLTVGLMTNGMGEVTAQNLNSFVDVPQTSYYYEHIHALANQGIINGYENGTYFKPNNTLTRGQMAKMFVNVIERNEVKEFKRSNKEFSDTRNTSFSEFASKAYRYGIVDGYSSSFHPNNEATRGQIAKLIVETFGFKKQGTYNPYHDTANTSFGDYVQILHEQGVTNSPNGLYHPNESVTRGQFAKMLTIALEKWTEQNGTRSNDGGSIVGGNTINSNNSSSNGGSVISGGNNVISGGTANGNNSSNNVVQVLKKNVSVSILNGIKEFNGLVTLTPQNTNGFLQTELDSLKNVPTNGQSVIYPALPVGTYTVTTTNLDGSNATVLSNGTITVKENTINDFLVRVQTQGQHSNNSNTDVSNNNSNNSSGSNNNGNTNVNNNNSNNNSGNTNTNGSGNGQIGEGNVVEPIPPTTSENKNSNLQSIDTMRNEFLTAINNERTSLGLSPVQYNSFLNDIASQRSKHMVSNNYFAHDYNGEAHFEELIKGYGYDVGFTLENLADVASANASGNYVFNGWKSSKGHYGTMKLPNVSFIGLDYAITSNGRAYITLVISDLNFGVTVFPE